MKSRLAFGRDRPMTGIRISDDAGGVSGKQRGVLRDYVMRRADGLRRPVAYEKSPITETHHRAEGIADRNGGLPGVAEPIERCIALFLETLVSDGEHLIEK